MTATIAMTVVVAVALLAAGWALLWLDRAYLGQLGWLVGVSVWAVTTPALARLIARSVVGDEQGGVRAAAGVDVVPAWPALASLALLAVVLPLLLLIKFKIVDGAGEGAVFGSASGLGFGVFVIALTNSGPRALAVTIALFVLVLCAGAGATLGAGFGLVELSASPRWRLAWVVPVAAVAALQVNALAFAARFCWEYWGRADLVTNLALLALALVVLAVALVGTWSVERRIIALQLREEFELGVLPAWVVGVIPVYWLRVDANWWPRRDERREIVRLLVALAFRKHELRALQDDSVQLYGLKVGRLRQRARTLLAMAPAAAPRQESAL